MKNKPLKKAILISFFWGIGFSVFGQTAPQGNRNCKDLKLDTLENDFIIEVNCDNLYYSPNDAIFQSNLIFLDPKFIDTNNGQILYNTDSVFIYNRSNGINFYKYKSCLDFNSLAVFHDKTENPLNKRKYRPFFKRSTIRNKNGILYLRFHAKMVVLNLGELEWNIPGIYCKESTIYKSPNEYCKHIYKNSLLLVEVIEFKYYSEYNKLQK